MGAILSYFFPESDHDTIEHVVEDKADKVTEELSAAREETQPANPETEAVGVTDLATEKEFEVLEDTSALPVPETEDEFEVVQENKIDFVQNVISKEHSLSLMEASPDPPSVESSGSIQDNKQVEEAIIDIVIAKPPFPEAIATPISESGSIPAPEQAKAITPEPTTELTNLSPGPEVIGSVEDNKRETDSESDE